MTTITTTTTPETTHEELLNEARGIGELAWRLREQTDRERRMPDEIMDALRASGLTKLNRHRRWGGAGADPMTTLDVGRELARGEPALGWVFSLLAMHDWYMAFTSEELQHEVYTAEPDAFIVDNIAPMGEVERVSDGYLVSGHWRFTSGIEWSNWVAVGAITTPPDADEDEHVAFFIPKSDLTVVDDWYTMGLRGTASRAIDVERVFVPTHRMFPYHRLATERGPVAEEGPLWRVPLMTMMGACIFVPSVGISQRMVEEFRTFTRNRIRPFEGGAEQRANPMAQLSWAEAATQWDATWALARAYVQEGWDQAVAGDWALTDENRAKYFAWRGYIGKTSAELCQKLFLGAGGNSLAETSPLQKLFRDVHSAAVHIGIDSGDGFASRGRVAMGFKGHPYH